VPDNKGDGMKHVRSSIFVVAQSGIGKKCSAWNTIESETAVGIPTLAMMNAIVLSGNTACCGEKCRMRMGLDISSVHVKEES
jgi:hypothetical protein